MLRQTLNEDTKIQQYFKNNAANDVHDNLIVMIWSHETLSLFWAISISHTKLEHNRSKTNMYTTSACLWSLYSRYAVVATAYICWAVKSDNPGHRGLYDELNKGSTEQKSGQRQSGL